MTSIDILFKNYRGLFGATEQFRLYCLVNTTVLSGKCEVPFGQTAVRPNVCHQPMEMCNTVKPRIDHVRQRATSTRFRFHRAKFDLTATTGQRMRACVKTAKNVLV